MAAAGFLVAIFALLFTVASFWWINARRGSVVASRPRAFAFADGSGATGARLRLPMVFFNTGARALIVEDLRLIVEGLDFGPFPWATTRVTLRPEGSDVVDFPRPFSVAGRASREIVVEFGDDPIDWMPDPSSRHRMAVQAMLHDREAWTSVVEFDWHAPPSTELMLHYLAHRNVPTAGAQTGRKHRRRRD